MKLYNLDHSPYATRVRMQIFKKELAVAIVPPPAAVRTAEFLARFPLGKIPVLELDGSQLPDLWVIMEYLEDVMPAISLRPEGARANAHMQLLARYADTCLGPAALFPRFSRVQVPGGTSDGAALAALDEELGRLQRLLEMLPDFHQRSLHLGDIALAPHMDYVLRCWRRCLAGMTRWWRFPLVASWWSG